MRCIEIAYKLLIQITEIRRTLTWDVLKLLVPAPPISAMACRTLTWDVLKSSEAPQTETDKPGRTLTWDVLKFVSDIVSLFSVNVEP